MAGKTDMRGSAAAKEQRMVKSQSSPSEQVLDALSDTKYKFRTVNGLAKTIKLPPEEIAAILENLGAKVRVANVTDAQGNLLYTLRTRSKGTSERIAELRSFLASSVRVGRG